MSIGLAWASPDLPAINRRPSGRVQKPFASRRTCRAPRSFESSSDSWWIGCCSMNSPSALNTSRDLCPESYTAARPPGNAFNINGVRNSPGPSPVRATSHRKLPLGATATSRLWTGSKIAQFPDASNARLPILLNDAHASPLAPPTENTCSTTATNGMSDSTLRFSSQPARSTDNTRKHHEQGLWIVRHHLGAIFTAIL